MIVGNLPAVNVSIDTLYQFPSQLPYLNHLFSEGCVSVPCTYFDHLDDFVPNILCYVKGKNISVLKVFSLCYK